MVRGAGGVSVTGSGSLANPYIISSDVNLAVSDSSTVDLTLSGDGSDASPFQLGANATVDLNALTDVDTTGGTTGQVLAKQADGTYRLVAPSTASPGAINLSSTGGLQGDGSAGNPLGLKLAPSSGLVLDSTGLKVSGGGAWTAYTPALTATTTNPSIGNGSMEGAYSQTGKTVHVSIEFTTGSSTTRGVGSWRLSLPVPPITSRDQVLPMQLSAVGFSDIVGVAKIESNGLINRLFLATSTAAQAMSHSVPSALGAGSRLLITGSYEAA